MGKGYGFSVGRSGKRDEFIKRQVKKGGYFSEKGRGTSFNEENEDGWKASLRRSGSNMAEMGVGEGRNAVTGGVRLNVSPEGKRKAKRMSAVELTMSKSR